MIYHKMGGYFFQILPKGARQEGLTFSLKSEELRGGCSEKGCYH